MRSLPSVFRADSHEIPDPEEIANPFCKYLLIVGPNLASQIRINISSWAKSLVQKYTLKFPKSAIREVKWNSSFLTPNLVNSIFLEVANEEEIIEIAVGHDNISMNLINDSILSILITSIITWLVYKQ